MFVFVFAVLMLFVCRIHGDLHFVANLNVVDSHLCLMSMLLKFEQNMVVLEYPVARGNALPA